MDKIASLFSPKSNGSIHRVGNSTKNPICKFEKRKEDWNSCIFFLFANNFTKCTYVATILKDRLIY